MSGHHLRRRNIKKRYVHTWNCIWFDLKAYHYVQGNLWSWLFNPDCQDQYSVIHNAGSIVSVFTNTNTEPKLVMKREVSCLVYIMTTIICI